MTSRRAELNLKARAGFFKALGHPTRLLIVNLVRLQPRHTDELASILGLSPGTVSHHLGVLAAATILEARKEQYYQVYRLADGALAKTVEEVVSVPQPGLDPGVEEDAFTRKVLGTFLRGGRLVSIPKQRKKLRVVLEEIVGAFEPGRGYAEREVNLVLAEFHDDFATLRRELVDGGLMTRARDGADYRRADDRRAS